MKKKVLITTSVVFSILILAWLICIFLFPVLILDGEAYNAKKLIKLGKQRELAYNELYISLHEEINNMIYYLYNKPIENKNEIEKRIIYNGDILLLDKINKNNFSCLTKEELRILRNTIFAKYGYIFQSKDLSKHFNRFTWYKPQYNNVDGRLSDNDRKLIELIREVENEQTGTGLQDILETFYTNAINIDKNYYQLMVECNSKISFPFQIKRQYLINDIFPARINAIKYNNQFYNEYALILFTEQYENIIKKIIEVKTSNIMEYIDFYSQYFESELITITDFTGYEYYYEITGESIFDYYMNQCIITNKIKDNINFTNFNLSDISILNIPVLGIDDVYYSFTAINEITKSMETVSPCLISNVKNILKEGINQQTEIYIKNISKYTDWYYSYLTSIDKTITNIVGFFTREKSSEEKFYVDNFNRIMNDNANYFNIIEDDLDKQIKIIRYIYNEYIELKNYFSVNIHQIPQDIIPFDDFIEPYIDDIVTYFEQVFEILDNANNFNIQDYTVKDNNVVKTARTTVKLLSSVNFFGGVIIDYLSLKTQKMLNRSELERQIYNSMIENQNNKITIINDPFNYIFDKLSIGSILFVDNYFAGLNTYQHYGVYIGDGKVIHFAPLEGQEISARNGVIHETALDKFLDGRALQVEINVEKKYSDNVIIQRARSRLGEKGYDLIANNCEHFARWCVTGENVSYQVKDIPGKLDTVILTFSENWNRVSKFVNLFY
jgi:hypothetical protein